MVSGAVAGGPRDEPMRPRPMRVTEVRAAAAMAAVLLGCGGALRTGGPAAAADPCTVVPLELDPAVAAAAAGPGAGVAVEPERAGLEATERPVVVAIDGPVDAADAPVPRTASERVVFANLYRTLVRESCDGHLEAVLAESWTGARGGRQWSFTLRPDVLDWEGDPITAEDVMASWLAVRAATAGGPGARATPAIASLAVVDRRTLRVELSGPAGVEYFARPELAVRTSVWPGAWPTGSGPYRPERGAATRASRVAVVGPGPEATRVEFRAVRGDARDALDTGVDVLVTEDPAVIEYAASSTRFRTVPLPWDRSYVLVVFGAGGPAAAEAADRPSVRLALPPDPALATLARDAVRVDARPARSSFDALQACGASADAAAPAAAAGSGPRARGEIDGPGIGGRAGRIVFDRGDAVAHAVAERLVALSLDEGRGDTGWLAEAVPWLGAGGGRVAAAGLSADSFETALRTRTEAAYVLPVERRAGAGPCDLIAAVRARAPWMGGVPWQDGPDARGAAGSQVEATIVPLVETRRTLIVGRGIGGIVVDGNGNLLLDGIGRGARAPAGIR